MVQFHKKKFPKKFFKNFPSLRNSFCFIFYFLYKYSIEGEYVPMQGDEVRYRLCIIPPKNEKHQAVHCEIINFCPKKHKRWEEASDEGHFVH